MYQSLLYYVLIISCTSKKKFKNAIMSKKSYKNQKNVKNLEKTQNFWVFSRFLLKKPKKPTLKNPGFFKWVFSSGQPWGGV